MGTRRLDGDELSRKQLGRTVAEGCRIIVHLPNLPFDSPLVGYLCGVDDYHWMVVTPEGKKVLVHKGAAALIELSDEPTLADEPRRDELERLVRPFVGYLEDRGLVPRSPVRKPGEQRWSASNRSRATADA